MAEEKWSELIKQYHTGKFTVPKEDINTLNLTPHNIWLQYKTITVGVGKDKKTFDLIKIFEGLERLAEGK